MLESVSFWIIPVHPGDCATGAIPNRTLAVWDDTFTMDEGFTTLLTIANFSKSFSEVRGIDIEYIKEFLEILHHLRIKWHTWRSEDFCQLILNIISLGCDNSYSAQCQVEMIIFQFCNGL